jgi:PAS domain S-box-containing protein
MELLRFSPGEEVRLWKIIVVASAYFLTGKLGLLLAIPPGVATVLWPPSGIALAASLTWGYRIWPGIWVGSLLVNIDTLFDPTEFQSALSSLGVTGAIATGSTLQALLGALAVQRILGSSHPFGKTKHVAAYLGVVMTSCLVAATVGATSLAVGGHIAWSAFSTAWWTWWTGDATGILLLTPILLGWRSAFWGRWDRGRVIEAILLLMVVYVASRTILGGWSWFGDGTPPPFPLIPVILWAAFRFGHSGVAVSMLIVSSMAIWGALHHVGPFIQATLNESLFLAQAFVGVMSGTGLVLAAALAEQKQTERYLTVQYDVARALAASATLREAARAIFKTVCEHKEWHYAALWQLDREAGVLRCVTTWHVPWARFPEFDATGETAIAPGVGLPGRVLVSAQPVWLADVGHDSNLPRASIAAKEGLRGAAAFPILHEGDVLGVFEFFSTVERQPDPDVLELMASIGSQIGQFMEQRRIAEAVQDSTIRIGAILESVLDCIVTIDDQGTIVEFNAAAEKTFGYDRGSAIGRQMAELIIPPSLREAHYHGFQRHLATGQSSLLNKRIEMRAMRADGTEFPVELSITRLPLTGRPLFTGFLRDLTARKRAEAERQRMDVEVQKAAKLESLGMLAAGIAHDFNNLLTAVVSNLYLVRTALDPTDPAGQRLRQAEESCLRAQTLTQQLLTFARGGVPVKHPLQLGDLLGRWVDFALGGSNVRAAYAIAPDLWLVDADEGQLNQVINNLVINAKEAMPHGGTLVVRAHNLTLGPEQRVPLAAGRYVQIAIQDQGPGISTQDLPNIFDPFFTTKPRGSGLGLTTSYAIVKKHGGYLAAESEPGRGSTFSIYLPASTSPVAAQTSRIHGHAVAEGNILFMDDEAAIRDAAGALLTHAGWTVACVSDGREAVERYRQALSEATPYDVVILDLTVPGAMGGQEAIRHLLALDPRVSAIVSSGYSDDPVVSEFRVYGFVGCLTKPYDPNDLIDLVSRVMREKRGADPRLGG